MERFKEIEVGDSLIARTTLKARDYPYQQLFTEGKPYQVTEVQSFRPSVIVQDDSGMKNIIMPYFLPNFDLIKPGHAHSHCISYSEASERQD